MHDFSLTQESDNVVHIGIIGKPQNVVIGDPSFLLGGHVLRQIADGIAFYCH